jgi:hypothetical protein
VSTDLLLTLKNGPGPPKRSVGDSALTCGVLGGAGGAVIEGIAGGSSGVRRGATIGGLSGDQVAFVVFGAALPLLRVDWVFPNRRKPDNMEIEMVSDLNLTIKAVFSN